MERLRAQAEQQRAWDAERSFRLSAGVGSGLSLFEVGSAGVLRAVLGIEKRVSRILTLGGSIYGEIGPYAEPQILVNDQTADSVLYGAGGQAMARVGRGRWFVGIGGFAQGVWIPDGSVEVDRKRLLFGVSGEGGIRFGPRRQHTLLLWVRTGIDDGAPLDHAIYMAGVAMRWDILIL